MLITSLAKIFAYVEFALRSDRAVSEAEVALQMSFLYVKEFVEQDGQVKAVIASTEPGEILTAYWIDRASGGVVGEEYLAD